MFNSDSEILIGKVKWYDSKKGFGILLEQESEQEIFIHHSNIQDNNSTKYVILMENELVKFQIQKDQKNNKLSAINVQPSEGKFKNEKPYRSEAKSLKLTNFNHQERSRHNRVKNTTDFEPNHQPVDLRLMIHHSGDKYLPTVTSRDVIIVKSLFSNSENIYQKLDSEINQSGIDLNSLWKSWHGDTHYIADDHLQWKRNCPTFNLILDRIAEFFEMTIKATRLNFYSDSSEWKPFHHDAAAVKEDKAKTQNFTVAVSFGLEREVAFQHAKNGTVISFPAEDGSVYVFSRDVNVIWKHGIRQIHPDNFKSEGRFSIIAWGWKDMIDM